MRFKDNTEMVKITMGGGPRDFPSLISPIFPAQSVFCALSGSVSANKNKTSQRCSTDTVFWRAENVRNSVKPFVNKIGWRELPERSGGR